MGMAWREILGGKWKEDISRNLALPKDQALTIKAHCDELTSIKTIEPITPYHMLTFHGDVINGTKFIKSWQ